MDWYCLYNLLGSGFLCDLGGFHWNVILLEYRAAKLSSEYILVMGIYFLIVKLLRDCNGVKISIFLIFCEFRYLWFINRIKSLSFLLIFPWFVFVSHVVLHRSQVTRSRPAVNPMLVCRWLKLGGVSGILWLFVLFSKMIVPNVLQLGNEWLRRLSSASVVNETLKNC